MDWILRGRLSHFWFKRLLKPYILRAACYVQVNTRVNHSLHKEQDSVFRWAQKLSCRPVRSCQQLIETRGRRQRRWQRSSSAAGGRSWRRRGLRHVREWRGPHDTLILPSHACMSFSPAPHSSDKVIMRQDVSTATGSVYTDYSHRAASSLWKVKKTMNQRGLTDTRPTPDCSTGWLKPKH